MANEDGFKNKLIRAFGLEELDEEEYDDYPEDDYIPDEPQYVPQTPPQATTTTRTVTKTATPVREEKSADVLVLDPTSFDEAPGIVNKLKQDKTIVVNLKQTDFEEGRKIFDFLSGAVFALEGSLNRIAESVFILAPKLISVSTEIEEPKYETSYSSEILSWEEE